MNIVGLIIGSGTTYLTYVCAALLVWDMVRKNLKSPAFVGLLGIGFALIGASLMKDQPPEIQQLALGVGLAFGVPTAWALQPLIQERARQRAEQESLDE